MFLYLDFQCREDVSELTRRCGIAQVKQAAVRIWTVHLLLSRSASLTCLSEADSQPRGAENLLCPSPELPPAVPIHAQHYSLQLLLYTSLLYTRPCATQIDQRHEHSDA